VPHDDEEAAVISGWDDTLLRGVNDIARATPWLHPAAWAFAQFGVVLFAGLLVCGAWLARRGPARTVAAALWAPLAVLLAVAVNQPLGRLVAAPRPYAVHPDLLVLVGRSADPSFPSDHAVMAGAVAAGLLLVHRRLGLVAALAAVLMAATRVYVGAHFPSDVVAGLVLGAGVSVVGWALLGRLLAEVVVVARRGPLRWLLAEHPRPAGRR
jgi:undecaprenyl-diphosphatase